MGGIIISCDNVSVNNIEIHGNDTIDIKSNVLQSVTLDGGLDNDRIQVGSGITEAYGQDGNDLIKGGVGDDHLEGGGGNDVIFGGAGNDHLLGKTGDDVLFGVDGYDHLEGDSGNNWHIGDGTNTCPTGHEVETTAGRLQYVLTFSNSDYS